MPMKSLIVRFEPHRTLQPKLADHVGGRTMPVEAIDREDQPPTVPVPGIDPAQFERTRAWLDAERRKKKRGNRGNELIDVLIAGPPPDKSADRWPDEKVMAWARDVGETFQHALPGGGRFIEASVHLWERAPHIQLQFAPVIDGRLSWKAVQEFMARALTGKTHPERRKQLSLIQDGFHEVCGEPYGLERGRVGSQAVHRAPDRGEGLIGRAADAEARSDEDRREKEAAEERADADRRRADAAESEAQSAADRRVEEIRREAERQIAEVREKAQRDVEDAEFERGEALERAGYAERSRQRVSSMLLGDDREAEDRVYAEEEKKLAREARERREEHERLVAEREKDAAPERDRKR